MSGIFSNSSSVRTLDAGDFPKQLAAIFVDNHYAILARDIEPVTGWIGHNVIPAPITAQYGGVGHVIQGR